LTTAFGASGTAVAATDALASAVPAASGVAAGDAVGIALVFAGVRPVVVDAGTLAAGAAGVASAGCSLSRGVYISE